MWDSPSVSCRKYPSKPPRSSIALPGPLIETSAIENTLEVLVCLEIKQTNTSKVKFCW